MSATSFPIGSVEGQIAELNDHIVSMIETVAITSSVTLTNIKPGCIVMVCRGANKILAQISPSDEVVEFFSSSYITFSYNGTTDVLTVSNSSGISFQVTVIRA